MASKGKGKRKGGHKNRAPSVAVVGTLEPERVAKRMVVAMIDARTGRRVERDLGTGLRRVSATEVTAGGIVGGGALQSEFVSPIDVLRRAGLLDDADPALRERVRERRYAAAIELDRLYRNAGLPQRECPNYDRFTGLSTAGAGEMSDRQADSHRRYFHLKKVIEPDDEMVADICCRWVPPNTANRDRIAALCRGLDRAAEFLFGPLDAEHKRTWTKPGKVLAWQAEPYPEFGNKPLRVAVVGGADFADAQAVASTLDSLERAYGIRALAVWDTPGACGLALDWVRGRNREGGREITINRFSSAAHDGATRNDAWLAMRKRNIELIDSVPDLVVAYPGGPATEDLVRRAWDAGIRVWEPVDA